MSLLAFNSEYYGDQTRWFVGTVIDGSPPYGLEGRVKVRIYGIHDESNNNIPQSDLPWAQVMIPSTSFGVSGLGAHPQILPGALVFGIFIDGVASQLPLILGSLSRQEIPTTVQAQGRQDTATNPFAYDFNQSLYEGVDPENLVIDNLNQRKTVAVKFFIDNGYTAEQAAGIVGTLVVLTKLDPLFEEGDLRGIVGWNQLQNRWSRLANFAGRFSPAKDINSFDLQLIYILDELRNTKPDANSKLLLTNDVRGCGNDPRLSCAAKGTNGAVSVFVEFYLPIEAKRRLNVTDAEEEALKIYEGLF